MFNNRKLLLVLLVIALLFTMSPAVAQDGPDLPGIYTTSDSLLTVRYPAGWAVSEGSQEAKSANVELASDSGVEGLSGPLDEGQISITIYYDDGRESGVSALDEADSIARTAFFMGQFSGFMITVAALRNFDMEWATTRLEDVEADGVPVTIGEADIYNSLLFLNYGSLTLVAFVPLGELETYRDLLMAIWGSIEYTPPAE